MTANGLATTPEARGAARLRLGTCPDSWGVWFADDPLQTPWSRFLARIVNQEYGLQLQFHPHADSHVETQEQTERFLDQTDPRYVWLCLDTGHLAYRHADSVAIITHYPERTGYVHIKAMDPDIVAVADRDGLAFGQAVAMGASCEPPRGEPVVGIGQEVGQEEES